MHLSYNSLFIFFYFLSLILGYYFSFNSLIRLFQIYFIILLYFGYLIGYKELADLFTNFKNFLFTLLHLDNIDKNITKKNFQVVIK